MELKIDLLDFSEPVPVGQKIPLHGCPGAYYLESNPKLNKYEGSSGVLVPTITDIELERNLSGSRLTRFAKWVQLCRAGIEFDGFSTSFTLAEGIGKFTEYNIKLNAGGTGVGLSGLVKLYPRSIYPRVVSSGRLGLFEPTDSYNRRRDEDFEVQRRLDSMYEKPRDEFEQCYRDMGLFFKKFEEGLKKLNLTPEEVSIQQNKIKRHEEEITYKVNNVDVVLRDPDEGALMRAYSFLPRGALLSDAREILSTIGKMVTVAYHLERNLRRN